ncbi:hypothetical protein Efla_002126 [Eimeria flavescens]
MSPSIAQYPLVAALPLTMGACATFAIFIFSGLILLLYRMSNTELTMLHRVHGCLRILIVAQTIFAATSVAILSSAAASSGSADSFSSLVTQRQAANILKASGAALVAGYSFFATEHQVFRWLALFGGVGMAGVDAVDMLDTGQLIGILHASESGYKGATEMARLVVLRALQIQYAAKIFSFFCWLLQLQIVASLMHALGWFELNELPDDEEVAGHLKELTRATINRRIQEKQNPEQFEASCNRRLFKPTDKLEVTWDLMVDQEVGRENRTSYPISTNPVGQIPPEVQKELCDVLLKIGIKRNKIYDLLADEDQEHDHVVYAFANKAR